MNTATTRLQSRPDPIPIQAAVGLGANLGNPAATIHQAVAELEKAGWRNTKLSSLYVTSPEDCIPGTPDFINAAVTGAWPGSPGTLLETCRRIESRLGRPLEHAKDEARVIDLDILIVPGYCLRENRLTVPHPHLPDRLFVLIPLAEIAPGWTVMTAGQEATVAELAQTLIRRTPDWHDRIRRWRPPDQANRS